MTVTTQVLIDQVADNPFQTRSEYGAIDELAADIGRNGLMQAPVGRLKDRQAKVIEIAFGHRRLQACRELGWSEIPVLLKPLDDEDMAKMAWAENAARKDLTAIERAEALRRMMEAFGWTQAQAASEVGLSRSAVANELRLLGLPEEAREAIQDGRMTAKHGRALLRLAPAGEYAVMDAFDGALEAEATAAEIADEIDAMIRNAVPLPTEAIEISNRWGHVNTYVPKFPLDWTPEDAGDLAMRGACEGCEFMVQFNNDPVARCTEDDAGCYRAKASFYRSQQEARDIAAIQEVIEINVATRDDCYIFGSWAAPREIFDDECRHCPHLRATWVRYVEDKSVHVDAEITEHVVYACHEDGRECREEKRQADWDQAEERKQEELTAAAEGGDKKAAEKIEKERARREKVEALEAEDAAARQLIEDWIGKQAPLAELWDRPSFRLAVARELNSAKASDSEDEVAEKVLRHLLDRKCNEEWMSGPGNVYKVYTLMMKTSNFLKKLEA